jgi:hypothetical protein
MPYGIAKRDDAVIGDVRDAGVRAAHTAMQAGNGAKDRGWIERIRLGALLQLVRQHVEQDLGV